MEYRRRRDTDTWHFDTACPDWPESEWDYEVRFEPPVEGERCHHCTRLAAEREAVEDDAEAYEAG